MRNRPQIRPQRGAAIITALLVVALATLLVAGLLWRQQIQVRRIENQRLAAQVRWIARGGVQFTRLVLRSAGDTSAVDYLGGVWAVPIAETRLSDFLGKFGVAHEDLGATTFLSGSIEDAQARFNLRDLVAMPVPGLLQPDAQQVASFARLLQLLGIDSRLAGAAAQALRASLLGSLARFQGASGVVAGAPFKDQPGLDGGSDDAAPRPLPLTSLDALLDVPGFTPDVLARLRPFVTMLPLPTPVNVNTAPAEVLAAVVPGLDLSAAQALVADRDRIFFVNLGDFSNRVRAFGVRDLQVQPNQLDVKTSFFVMRGRVRHGRAELNRDVLIYRNPLTHTTQIVAVADAN